MTKICDECHHTPSGRWQGAYGAQCYCKCHNVADASPALLAAAKAVVQWLAGGESVAHGCVAAPPADHAALQMLQAAIAEAEIPY